MKKHLRSVLAVLLAAILLLSSLPLSVLANGGSELPVVMFEEDGSISDEAYPYLYDTAKFTNAYFYGGFDGYWQTYVVQAAYNDAEVSAMVREQDEIYYILADADLIHEAFGAFFPAPLGFVDDTVLPALREGEGLGEIPAYDEGAGTYLVKAISLEEQWDDLFVYHGFTDNDDGTGSFYFARVAEWVDDEPVPDGTGAEIVLRPTEEGIELVSHRALEALPESVDRRDVPEEPGNEPEPRNFDYEWGLATADFLEDYREEYLKDNIARLLYSCAVYNKQYDALEDGVATLNWDQLVWVYDECFGHCSPLDPETGKEYFDGTFVMDVAAGNIPGMEYVVDFERPDDEGYFTLADQGPVNDRLHYEYRGWIENENGDGGEFYFVKIENAWFDEETGETRVEYGEGGIRIELLVIDGRMTEIAYEYVETLPPEEAYSPEPEPETPGFDYWWGWDVAHSLELYMDEGLKQYLSGVLYEVAVEEGGIEPEDGCVVLSEDQLRQAFDSRFPITVCFFEDTLLPAIREGEINGLTFDAGSYTVRDEWGIAAQTRYQYVGWIEAEDHNGGSFYYAVITGFTESYDTILGEAGIRIDLHAEDGSMICDSYEYVDVLPETFDLEPGQHDEGYERRVAEFVEDFIYECGNLNLCGKIVQWYRDVMPDAVMNDSVTVSAYDFVLAVECNLGDRPANFIEDYLIPAAKAGDLNGITYDEATDSYTVEDGGGNGERMYCYRGWTNEEDGVDAFWFFKIDGVDESGNFYPDPSDPSGVRVLLLPVGGEFELVGYGEVESLPEHFNDDPGTEPEISFEERFDREKRAADFVEGYCYEIFRDAVGAGFVRWFLDHAPERVEDHQIIATPEEFEEYFRDEWRDAPRDYFRDVVEPAAQRGEIPYMTWENGSYVLPDDYAVGAAPNYDYAGWIQGEDGSDAFYYRAITSWNGDEPVYGEGGIEVIVRMEGNDVVLVSVNEVGGLPDVFDPEPCPGPRSFNYDWGLSAAYYVEEYNDEVLKGKFAKHYFEFATQDFGVTAQEDDDGQFAVISETLFRTIFETMHEAPEGCYEELRAAVAAGEINGISYDEANDVYVVRNADLAVETYNYRYMGWIAGEDGNGGEYYFAKITRWWFDPENFDIAFEYGEGGVRVALHVEDGRMILDNYEYVDVLPEEFDPEPGDEPGGDWYVPQDPTRNDLFFEGDWNYDVVDDKAIIIRYLGETATDVAIPDTLGGHPVVGVGDRAFLDRDNIETLYIPASVVDISHDAFFACSNLTTITLAQGMDPRDNRMEDGCLINNRDVLVAAVKHRDALPAVKHIGDGALTGRVANTVIIDSATEDIGAYAFAFSDTLHEVIMPDSVTRIGDCAFKDCNELEAIYFNGSPEDWAAMEIGAGNETLLNARVEFVDKVFVGNNVSVFAPNGTAARGTFLSGDGIEPLPNEEKDRLPEGFETETVYRAIVELSVGFETQEGYQTVPANLTGPVTVGVKIPEDLQGKYLAAIWLPEEGDPVILEGKSAEGNYFLFDTDEVGAFILAEVTLRGVAEQVGLPGVVFEEGDVITIPERQSVLLSFRQQYREFDLIAGWRNDLLEEQGFDCPIDPVFDGDNTYARVGTGSRGVGDTGTLTVSWYHFSDIFGPEAVGWVDAIPVYTCEFTLEVGEPAGWIDANVYGKEGNSVEAGGTIRIEEGKDVYVYFALNGSDQDPCPLTYDGALRDAGFTVDDEPTFLDWQGMEGFPYVHISASGVPVGTKAQTTVSWVRFADAFGDPEHGVAGKPREEWEYLATATWTVEVVPEHVFGEPVYDVMFMSAAEEGYNFYDTAEAAAEAPKDALHIIVTATRTCECGEEYFTGARTTSEVTKPATCTEKGETTYTFTFEEEGYAYDPIILANVPTDPAAHSFGEPVYTWSLDAPTGDDPAGPVTCTAVRACACGETETETVEATVVTEGEVTTYTATFTNAAFASQTRTVSGEEPAILWGDANGDGKVSNLDIVRLKNYLANYDDDTGISSNGATVYVLADGADANGDGKISNLDIVRLKNYLANYDDDTGISSNGSTVYILGPKKD